MAQLGVFWGVCGDCCDFYASQWAYFGREYFGKLHVLATNMQQKKKRAKQRKKANPLNGGSYVNVF